jgi:hypothetical protein
MEGRKQCLSLSRNRILLDPASDLATTTSWSPTITSPHFSLLYAFTTPPSLSTPPANKMASTTVAGADGSLSVKQKTFSPPQLTVKDLLGSIPYVSKKEKRHG